MPESLHSDRQKLDVRLLDRYLAGDATEQERAAVARLLAADSRKAAMLDALVGMPLVDDASDVSPDVEYGWRVVRRRMRETATRAGRPWSTTWRVAAAVALVAGATFAALRSSHLFSPPSATSATAARSYATARGERATVTLADGSHAVLGPESALDVLGGFGGNVREVRLRGEGYFEVAHDRTRPFRVRSGAGVVEVLGTRFGVRARADEDVRVVVAEGRVAFGGAVLARGDLARLASDSVVQVEHGVNVGVFLGWTEGRLAFESAPLPEVLAELARWFDREFVLGDPSLASLRLTASLHDTSLQGAINVLQVALGVRCEVRGRRVIVRRPTS